jgi:N-acetylmuramoyl-L-alanine amidase
VRNERAERTILNSHFSLLFTGFLLALLATVSTLTASALPAGATVIRRTWIERRGEVFTIHVLLSGRPRWVLSQQDNRLLIDLIDTESDLPANQFLQAPLGALGMARISPAPDRQLRVQINVTGKCDYVVGRKRQDLIVSVAPSGANLNLADAFSSAPRTAHAKVHPPRGFRPVRPAHQLQVEPEHIASASALRHDAVPPATREEVTAPSVRQDAIARADAVAIQPGGGRPVVVVDAGHGGHDPGTRSADGILEKDLALQIARRLADALEHRGVNAVLTRDRDVFLTLAQRTAIANQLSPELFISIHLNWSPNPGTTGMEVYYLNNTTDRATIRLARMENGAEGGGVPLDGGLNYILSDLRQQYKATESALLAQVMEQETVSELQASFGGGVRGLGAKRGPFYVLVGARIPAVLVECGFLSNAQEAQRLASATYQQALADALAGSVVHYLNQDVTAGTL